MTYLYGHRCLCISVITLLFFLTETHARPIGDLRIPGFGKPSDAQAYEKSDFDVFTSPQQNLIDGIAASRHGRQTNLYAKRACKYNLGISNDCDYRDAAQAAMRRRFSQSRLSPGKRGVVLLLHENV